MKTSLRLLLFIGLLVLSFEKLNAQCTVSNIIIQNVSVAAVQTPGTCTVTFDASFNIEDNNGNKYIFIHAWLQSQYPDYFHCVNGQTTLNGAIQAPQATDLSNAFLNIGIDNNTATPVILTTYPPDPSVPLTTVASITKTVLPDGSANIILTGVTTTLPGTCSATTVTIADLWSSQAANAQVAHCVNCGILSSAGYFNAAGLVNCFSLTYNVTLTNNTTVAISGYYRVYADVNGDSHFTPNTDTLITDTTAFNIGAGIGTTSTISGPVPGPNLNQNLFVLFTQTSGSASGASMVVLLHSTQCSPLPISFRSFTATRINRSNVTLKWETATESNNNGFALQRNIGDNIWQTIAFISSQARDGNSSSLLVYTYNDLNASKGITQYRVQQVDLDGKSRFSEIRAVRGEGQKGKTIVYPNPSFDGRVNILFEDKEGSRNVMLMDINGRIIRQWKNISGNTIQVDNLVPGIYSMRIVVLETGEQSVEKIVISRR
jgi:hypothetical protein